MISIHAPSMGSDRQRRASDNKRRISIHAPRMGSDNHETGHTLYLLLYFNPRSPHGERLVQELRDLVQGDFNPRSPHGERRFNCDDTDLTLVISIHAPRMGSDSSSDTGAQSQQSRKFQSTLPAWGATKHVLSILSLMEFQSTLPAWGATS